MARYVIRATGSAGPVEFKDRLTIEAALHKAQELGEANFQHVTLINVLTGVEITDLESLIALHSESPEAEREQ